MVQGPHLAVYFSWIYPDASKWRRAARPVSSCGNCIKWTSKSISLLRILIWWYRQGKLHNAMLSIFSLCYEHQSRWLYHVIITLLSCSFPLHNAVLHVLLASHKNPGASNTFKSGRVIIMYCYVPLFRDIGYPQAPLRCWPCHVIPTLRSYGSIYTFPLLHPHISTAIFSNYVIAFLTFNHVRSATAVNQYIPPYNSCHISI